MYTYMYMWVYTHVCTYMYSVCICVLLVQCMHTCNGILLQMVITNKILYVCSMNNIRGPYQIIPGSAISSFFVTLHVQLTCLSSNQFHRVWPGRWHPMCGVIDFTVPDGLSIRSCSSPIPMRQRIEFLINLLSPYPSCFLKTSLKAYKRNIYMELHVMVPKKDEKVQCQW